MRRPGPDEWMTLLAEYESSGLQQKEFVEKHQLSLSTFQYWLYRKSKTVQAMSNTRQRFLPVVALPSPALEARAGEPTAAPLAREPIELELPGGVRLRLPPGTTARFLGELLVGLR